MMTVASFGAVTQGDDSPQLESEQSADRVVLKWGDVEVATYRFQDPNISRPYFCTLRTPTGIQITRHHPPNPDLDLVDHDLFHPGLWLAFGDLDGADSWRLKAPVVHESFAEPRHATKDGISWTVVNNYLRDDGKSSVCRETNRLQFLARPSGYLIVWDSTFQSDRSFYFGDQEELGLGFRVATPISVRKGGRMVNSDGGVNEAGVWGKQADWCAYEGTIDGRTVGLLLMPHPENIRKSWFHARDYGFMAANPFGQNAFTGAEKSRIEVPAGKPFSLRYGVYVYDVSKENEADLKAMYADYLRTADLP